MLLGGYRNGKSCYSFSITNQQWTKLQDLPSQRNGSAVIDSSVFLVGGYKNSSIAEYNTVTNKFANVCTIKRSLFSSAICRDSFGFKGNSLFIACGEDDKHVATNNCFVFKTKTKAIRDVGSLKFNRSGNVLINFKGKIFCIGGYNGSDIHLNSIEVFDATTEKWKATDFKLNIARSYHQAVANKQFIYVLGGYNRSGFTDSIEKIELSAGKVELLSVKLKHARSLFAASKIDNDLYIFGGRVRDGSSNTTTNSTEILNLETLEMKEGLKVPTLDHAFTACSL